MPIKGDVTTISIGKDIKKGLEERISNRPDLLKEWGCWDDVMLWVMDILDGRLLDDSSQNIQNAKDLNSIPY